MERQPIALRADNFTPLARTPWAGSRLLGRYKRAVLAGSDPSGRVGESWELSVSDELPTRTADGKLLRDVLAEQPADALGYEARLGRTTTSLLVKWLDADDELSLQIHPQDDYAGLADGETGKVEAWYVVAAEPSAGFFFGFRPGVRETDVRAVLAENGDLRACMEWVPAVPGDFALITPGLPHAVGRGLTLIEPQRVLPGKRALTYRYWDFGRRYDERGQPSASGQPRALHLDHALAVTAFERVTDRAWLASRRASFGWPASDGRAQLQWLCGDDASAGVRSDALRMARLCGSGALELPALDALCSLTVVEGEVRLGAGAQPTCIAAGTTVALPACLGAQPLQLSGAHALLCATLG
jgi:mannose-6-phosphate isomerase